MAAAHIIAVDPLEGTNLDAYGQGNAITVLAASERGGLLNAPDTYLEKLCVGPAAVGKVDIRLSPAENLDAIARSLGFGPAIRKFYMALAPTCRAPRR